MRNPQPDTTTPKTVFDDFSARFFALMKEFHSMGGAIAVCMEMEDPLEKDDYWASMWCATGSQAIGLFELGHAEAMDERLNERDKP